MCGILVFEKSCLTDVFFRAIVSVLCKDGCVYPYYVGSTIDFGFLIVEIQSLILTPKFNGDRASARGQRRNSVIDFDTKIQRRSWTAALSTIAVFPFFYILSLS
jgi:hypothetical protein